MDEASRQLEPLVEGERGQERKRKGEKRNSKKRKKRK